MKIGLLLASILPLSCLFGATEVWNVNASGNWSAAGNWSPAVVPNAVNEGAQISPTLVITAPRTIMLDISPTIGTLSLVNLNNSNGYTIVGPGTLNFDAGGVTPVLQMFNTSLASYVISAPITFGAFDLLVDQHALGQTLTLSGGMTGGASAVYSGASTVILSGTNNYTTTSLNGTGTLRMASINALPVGRPVNLTVGASGTVLDLNGLNQSIGNLSSAGTGGIIQLGTGHLTINQTGSVTFSGVIDGNGSGTVVDWTGSGVGSVWTLGAAQTYTGVTSITNGTIRITGPEYFPGSGGLILAANGVLDLNGYQQTISDPVMPLGSQIIMNGAGGVSILSIYGSAPVDIFGVISDGGLGGSVVWNGSGGSGLNNVTIHTPQTYTGGTTIVNGTMLLGVSNGLFPGGNVNVSTTAGTFDLNGFSQTVGQLTGVGSVRVISPGVLTVAPPPASTFTFGGVISQTGSVVLNSAGTVWTLAQAQTYTGGTTITDGTIRLGVSSGLPSGGDVTLGATGVLNLNNFNQTIGQLTAPAGSQVQLGTGTLTLQPTASATIGGQIIGTGSVVWNGGAATVTTLGFPQTYTGGTTINSGTVRLGVASGLASGGNVTLGAAGILDLSGFNQTVSNLTGPAGAQVQLGTGNLTVQVNAGPVVSYLGSITGTGLLDKTGAGTLAIGGVSSTGGTTVSAGELRLVGGSLGGAVQVNAGSLLSGAGTVGSVVNDGTVSPTGILNVTGSYTQNAGGAFNVGISATGAPNRLVAGTATLNGTLNVSALHGAYAGGQQFRILTAAGGVTPAFSTVNLPSFLDLTLTYEPNAVVLTLGGQSILPLSSVKHYNPNQVLDYIRAIEHKADSDLIQIIDTLGLLDTDQLTEALDQLHPAPFGAFDLLNVSTSRQIISLLSRHMGRGCCESLAAPKPRLTPPPSKIDHFQEPSLLQRSMQPEPAAEPKREGCCSCADTSFWVQPFGSAYSQDNIGEEVGFFATTSGIVGGVGHRFQNHIQVGVGGGYSSSRIHWDKHLGRGSLEAGYFGVYTDYTRKTYYLEASAIGSIDHFSAKRYIKFTTINSQASHRAGGCNFTAHLGGGGEIRFSLCDLTPFINIDYVHLFQKGFSEHGAGDLNLVVQGRHSNILRSEIGLSVTKSYNIGTHSCFSPTLWLSGINEAYLSNELYHSRFIHAEPGFKSRPFDRSLYLVAPGIDLSFWFKKRFNFALRYSAELNAQIADQKADARLEWLF